MPDFDVTFAYPWVLFLLLLLPLLAFVRIYRTKKKNTALLFSDVQLLPPSARTLRSRLNDLPFYLRLLALGFLIVAMARPQNFTQGERVLTEGIDIAIALDISGSMLAQDFRPDRLTAAKAFTDSFIVNRANDRIGLVVFAGEAFTQCPLTIDYGILRTLLREVKSGMLEDGTAIGNALANAVNRLRDSKAKSKVIILLTDGVNNRGSVDPLTAAQIAEEFGVKVYTIGVGTHGMAPYPVQTPLGMQTQMMKVEIDEKLMEQISNMTGGRYYRAVNNTSLGEVFRTIDALEKTELEVNSFVRAAEKFLPWLLIGLALLLLDIFLSLTVFRRLP